MNVHNISLTLLFAAACAPAFAQPRATIPLRTVTAPLAASLPVGSIDELFELSDGNVLLNDGMNRSLVLLDGALQLKKRLADSLGGGKPYPG